MEVQEFDFDILHRKGLNNQNADALSKLPFQDQEKQTSSDAQSGANGVHTHASSTVTPLKLHQVSETGQSVPILDPSIHTCTSNNQEPTPESSDATPNSVETHIFSSDTVQKQVPTSRSANSLQTNTDI